MKATATANSNIAFVKYWGKADSTLFTPTRPNLSMTKEGLSATTTIEFSKDYDKDIVIIDGKEMSGDELGKAVKQVDLLRKIGKTDLKMKMVSKNNFPMAAGMASSASGFAAMTVAGCAALGIKADAAEMSRISRQGSGSSCRSIQGGFNEWTTGNHETSYAHHLYDADYMDMRDVIAVVSSGKKKISSRAGMAESMKTCPYYTQFVEEAKKSVADVKKGFAEKDFKQIGEVIEREALLMHAVMFTTNPAIIYWAPGTMSIMHDVRNWRDEGLECYFTIDAGPNMHVICSPESANKVEKRIKAMEFVEKTYHCKPGSDAKLENKHLF